MASDAEPNTESINERVNLTSEFTNEKQDEQMKKVIKFVKKLMHMERTMNDSRDEIIRLNYNENVLVNRNNPRIVQSSLDSYAGLVETYDKDIIKIMPTLYLIVMGLTNTFKKRLEHERVIALYELVCMEFQAIFGIIDAVLYFSVTVCGKTKNKKTFKKWLKLCERYFEIVKKVNRVSAVICKEFEMLFDAIMSDMTQLDEILQENNEMIDTYKEAYNEFRASYQSRFKINQSQSNQPNHKGGRAYKRGKRMTKRRKRHGRTHKNRV